MAKSNSQKTNTTPEEILALLFAFFFTMSVNTNLHNFALWRRVDNPSVLSLAVSLALIAYTFSKTKRLGTVSVIALTILATSGFIWFSGFHVNTLVFR